MSKIVPSEVLSHWSKLCDGLEGSSDALYSRVEERLNDHGLKDVRTERVTFAQGGMFAGKREYLQVRRGEHVYHVCGAPYGNGFFVSSWLGWHQYGFWALISRIPIVGLLARRFLKPLTFFAIDTAQAFHAVVHSAVTATIDEMLSAKSLRPLSEADRKPVMRDVWSML